MEWTYHFWWEHRGEVDQPRPLQADHIVTVHLLEQRSEPIVDDWLRFMEIAYMSCRVLMIGSSFLHPEGFYCAAQTIERGMKAIMMHRGLNRPKGKHGHDLKELATILGGEFSDPQFIELCRRLTVFQEAGRYPDSDLSHFVYPLTILTFLDGFVVRCRELCGKPRGSRSSTADAIAIGRQGHEVQQAAAVAICDKNRFLVDLGVPVHD